MSRYNPRVERPRRRGNGCLAGVVTLVWIALLLVVGYQFFLKPRLSQYVGGQIAERANQPAPTNGPDGATDEVTRQAQQALPTVVAALPSGTVRVTQQQANEFLASRSLGPVDKATIRFVPNEVQIDLTAFGSTSTARTGLAVQNGRVIAINPTIDGLLGQFVSLADLTKAFEQQINDQLGAQGRTISQVQVNAGEIVVTVENQ